MVFSTKQGSRVPAKMAAAIAAELELLRDDKATIHPTAVVEAARNPDNIMHEYFEWDDNKAAEEYRLHQARHLICSITVEFTKADTKEPIVIRAYQHVEKHGYMAAQDAMRHENYRSNIISQAFRDAAAFQQKYAALNEVAGIIKAIEKTMKIKKIKAN